MSSETAQTILAEHGYALACREEHAPGKSGRVYYAVRGETEYKLFPSSHLRYWGIKRFWAFVAGLPRTPKNGAPTP